VGRLQHQLQQVTGAYTQQHRDDKARVRALQRQLQEEQRRHQEQLADLRAMLKDAVDQEAARDAQYASWLLGEREVAALHAQQAEVSGWVVVTACALVSISISIIPG
jgi:hypothetical protein